MLLLKVLTDHRLMEHLLKSINLNWTSFSPLTGITYCYQCGDSDLTDMIFDSPKFENLYVNTFLELQPCEMNEKYIQCDNALYCSTVFVKQEGSKKVRVAFKGAFTVSGYFLGDYRTVTIRYPFVAEEKVMINYAIPPLFSFQIGCSDAKIDRKLKTKDGLNFDMVTCGSRFCNGPRDSAFSNHVSIYLLAAIILNHIFINKRVFL